MSSYRRRAAPVLASLFMTLGCARGPDVGSGLGLRRVVIYRNGVAYFERQGRVDEDEVSFRVRAEKVGDFLATLAVIEQGDSSVRSASFPVDVEHDKDGDDEEEEAAPEATGPDTAHLQLLQRPPVKKKKKDRDHLETVKLMLDGKSHDLIVGYVAETPVWRPSYRLVITRPASPPGAPLPKPSADLQAWGIVQNISGEDWKGVKLSLVAGAPIAFQATLEKAVIPQRPIVSDEGEVIASVPGSETTLGKDFQPPPPPPPPMEVDARGGLKLDDLTESYKDKDVADAKRPASKKRVSSASPKGGTGRAAEAPGAAPASPRVVALEQQAQGRMVPRNVRALAAVATEGGATTYELPFPVDVPNHSATMVLLLSKSVPGDSNFLFAPDGGVPDSSSHPFRVVSFMNDTKGLLERGPIAVFENGAFLGQGMVDPLPSGATATVPFALERSLAVQSARESNEEGSRLAHIEGGRIEIERDWVTHTKYTVKNGSDREARVVVKHGRAYDTRLHDAPKGTEDNTGTGTALVPVDVPAGAQKVLDVDERRIQRRGVDWLDPLANDAVTHYMADQRADPAVVAQLRGAWEARAKLRTTLDERERFTTEREALDRQIAQLNSSLRAIEKNKLAEQLRRDLTERLTKATARIDDITKRTVVLEMQVSEQSIRFRDLVNVIKMLKPLPVP